MVRSLIIGDVHGCLDELDQLLRLVSFRSGSDALYLVGDLVDRGPDSAGVVRRVRELGGISVKGNHDDKVCRYANHERVQRETGKPNPMRFSDEKKAAFASLTEDDLNWLASLPLYVRVGPGLVVVHGGFEPGVKVEDQDKNCCLRLRFIDKATRKYVASTPVRDPPNSNVWSEVWDGFENVVAGHNVHDLYHPRVDETSSGAVCYGIDTGCAFGGVLTALAITDAGVEFARVRGQKYAKLIRGEDD